MRYIYVILTVLILSSACNAQSSPNAPPAATLPASPNTPIVTQPTTAPTTTQPTIMSSDEAIRIARTEMERDAYKQAWQESQRSVDTIKWAFTFALSAIGIILALFAYVAYKETKRHEKAVAEAEQAAKDAKKWEQDAKIILANVDTQAKGTLDKIREEGKKQISEMLVEAETQRKISQLWNDYVKLLDEGKYAEACEQCSEIDKLKPRDYLVFNNWGSALSLLARFRKDEELFKQACQKFEQAIQFVNIESEKYAIYYNWGVALAEWAKLKDNEELFEQANKKFEQAIKINPTRPDAYDNWAGIFIHWSKLKRGTPEFENLLKQAEEKALKAEFLRKGSSAYRLAKIYAIRNDKENCKKWLLAGQGAGTLPARNEAMKDSDLDSVKDEAWFKEIKWKGEK